MHRQKPKHWWLGVAALGITSFSLLAVDRAHARTVMENDTSQGAAPQQMPPPNPVPSPSPSPTPIPSPSPSPTPTPSPIPTPTIDAGGR